MANEVSEATTDNCIRCGKSLEGLRRRSSRKFCSDLCRTRHFALKRYYEIKDTPGYKAKRSVYEKEWRKNNPEKWKERMKKATQRYRAKKKLEKQNQSNIPGEREITSGGQSEPSSYENNTAFVSEPKKLKRNNYEVFD